MIRLVGLSAVLDGGPSDVAPARREALAAGAWDLRVAAAPSAEWETVGLVPLGPGELAMALPVRLPDAAATRAAGARLAGFLRAGDLLVLTGPLGAGKTTFTAGLGQGLGVRGRVTSPTFVLAREHRGPLPLVHVDAYRLVGGGALEDLELDLALRTAVVAVEWGEGLVEDLSEDRLEIALSRPLDGGTSPTGPDSRLLTVRARGARWSAVQSP